MWRVATFDQLGRIVSESDEFFKASDPNAGNVIRYSYDGAGNLTAIIDPVNRRTTIDYYEDSSDFAGLVKQIEDWHKPDHRTTKYEYYANHNLKLVSLPEAKAADGVPTAFNLVGSDRPKVEYIYATAGGSYSDKLELATNLKSIQDGAAPVRVTFTFDSAASAPNRDRIDTEKWGTGEEATFHYPSPSQVEPVDAMGQKRTYTLTAADQYDKRVHINTITEHEVPTVTATALPATAPTTNPATNESLITSFNTYNNDGQIVTATYPSGLSITNEWIPANGGAPGTILKSITQTGPYVANARMEFAFDTLGQALNNVDKVKRQQNGPAVEREEQTPSRARLTIEKTDDVGGGTTIINKTIYNDAGQVTDMIQANAAGVEKMKSGIVYFKEDATDEWTRSRPFVQFKGSDLEKYNFLYFKESAGGERIEARDAIRNTLTETTVDSHGRATSVKTTDGVTGDTLTHERFGYDGAGRLRYHSSFQSPHGHVETRIEYDAVGRETQKTLSDANVNGASTILTQKTDWQLGLFKVTRFDPAVGASTAGARETQTLDTLGRPLVTERMDTAGNRIRTVLGYDKGGNLAYVGDGTRLATQHLFDALGREIDRVAVDGTRNVTTWNAWGEPTEEMTYTPADVLSHSKNLYTEEGRLRARNEQIGPTTYRHTDIQLTDGGTTTTVQVGKATSLDAEALDGSGVYRTTQTIVDDGGRPATSIAAAAPANPGPLTDITKMFGRTTTKYKGPVVDSVTTEEPQAGVSYVTTFDQDGLGRTTSVKEAGGAYVTNTSYDEAGNVISVQRPPTGTAAAKYDSRGLVTERTMPDGKVLHYQYDAIGNLRQYSDETSPSEVTIYHTDSLGRVEKIQYPDSSTEEVRFEDATGVVTARRDRTGQWVSYTYDAGGRVSAVVAGLDPTAGTKLVRYDYDGAGRLVRVRNKDAGTEYAEYDLFGHPGITRSVVYANASGATDTPVVRDIHTQRHVWNEHGERDSWRMPAAGEVAPAADDPASRWLQTIVEVRDAGANLIEQKHPSGVVLVGADGRATSRLRSRTQWTSGAQGIKTRFGYADGTPSAVPLPGSGSPATSGLPLWNETSIAGMRIAGLSVSRDAVKRLDEARDFGVGNRSDWEYDARGRLTDTWLALPSATIPVTDTLVDADFRKQRTMPPALDATQHDELGETLSLALDPPTWTATKTSFNHAIDERQLYLDGAVKQTLDYTYSGARRQSDGTWSYTYDEFGHMTSATSASAGRRIEMLWNPDGRLVARTAFRGSAAAWLPEDRADVLAADGLPADTTFVWDPIVDRLVAVFKAGTAPPGTAVPEAGLLRQYLHGDQGYDDPVQVRIAETVGSAPRIYYPLSDSSGAGSLSSIVGDDGNLVERVLYADAYGDAPRYLQGPVVDKITLEASKTSDGAIDRVKVRLHLSERITPGTFATGTRLASVKADRTVAQLALGSPTLENEYTILWELLPSEWQSLVDAPGADALEIVANDSLRGEGWGNSPVAPIPAWALKLYGGTETTAAQPVVKREKLSLLTSFIASLSAGETRQYDELYEIKSLYLAGNTVSKARLLFDFHLLPLREPATGLIYSRARWYDSSTGTFLSPDPTGYTDSSNLYAFCGDDPVNCSDPSGLLGVDGIGPIEQYVTMRLAEKYVADPEFAADFDAAWDVTTQIVQSAAFQGTLQVVGGCGEAVGGAYAAAQSAGLAAVPGWIAMVHGSDVCGAGFRTLWTGQVQETLTKQGAEKALVMGGMDPALADTTATYFDMGVSLYGSVSSARTVLGLGRQAAIVGFADDVAVDSGLAARLDAYRTWKANAGIEGTPTSQQFRRFVGAHRPGSRGVTLYPANTSQYAQWIRSIESESRTYYLYQKVSATGQHLKYGITYDLYGRYSPAQLAGGRLRQLAHGPKVEMLRLERGLHSTLPLGPEEGQQIYRTIQRQKGLQP
ncbi:MAG: RHS repeat-associated core domain-containing protein [Thermoanaerobaculia bacterium]